MKLKTKREELNLTQREIAQQLQITTQAYANYEQGLREPSLKTLCKLADYYNVSLDYLCDRTTKYDLPALTTAQIELMKIIIQLNKINLGYATSYVLGLLANQ